MDAKIRDRQLGRMLDGLVVSQRQDIDAFSKGHLNENNLYKTPDMASHKPWKSSQKKQLKMREKSQIPPRKGYSPSHRTEGMKQVMTNFSLGATTNAQLPPVSKHKTTKDSLNKRSQVWTSVDDERISTMQSTNSLDRYMKGPRQFDRTNDNVLVEELSIPEIMLRNPASPGRLHKSKAWAEDEPDSEEDSPDKPMSQGELKSRNLARFQHKFVPSHLEGVTKKDQFRSFQNFESSVLRKQDAMETNVLAGLKSVEHLERKLQKELDSLQHNGYGPNFHRLQVYSNVFDDLNSESSTFGYILRKIKGEYDGYISWLLDKQTARHKLLYDQVEQLSARGTSQPQVLNNEQKKVEAFEHEAKKQLEANDKLRRQLAEEMELATAPSPEPVKESYVFREDPVLELADQVEQLHTKILQKLDELRDLRNMLRNHYVPSTVCTHLEQCIKETELDIQRLTSQKEYFDRSTADLERELEDAVTNADTTDRDTKRLWKKVNRMKNQGARTQDGSTILRGGKPLTFEDSDDEVDDETKWNWYIQ